MGRRRHRDRCKRASDAGAAAPTFYVDSCFWFNGNGSHFVTAGDPELVAQKVAAYYSAHP